MAPKSLVDPSGFINSLKKITLTDQDMLQVEGAGAKVLINRERTLVPVDTGTTKNSIRSHYVEISNLRIVDDVGAETNYAPTIEYGRSDMPSYPMQPFIRPAAFNGQKEIVLVIGTSFGSLVVARWA